MATYRLTINSDVRNGTEAADTFDGYEADDGFGATGGTDTLAGRGGDDVFLINSEYSDVAGSIDGGADADTVKAYGFDLGSISFTTVETLSIEAYEFGATIAQLNAFSTLTTSIAAMDRIDVYLRGAGGTIDVSDRMAPGKSVELNAAGLSSGYTATGTGLADVFTNSSHDDVVHGGGGADLIRSVNPDGSSGGFDRLYGDAGNDTFQIRRQSGVVDGGSGTDTVVASRFTDFRGIYGDLGDASFVAVERLSVGPTATFATLSQLNSFATIFGGNADRLILLSLSGGEGGAIDFSTRLTRVGEHVWFRADKAASAVQAIGTANDDILEGSRFADTLTGGAGDDYLAGADFVTGADVADRLFGGIGDDTYLVDAFDRATDLVGPDGGVDTVVSLGSCNLASARFQGEIENLTLVGTLGNENPDTNGYGNGLDNVITGNGGDNLLDGRSGGDRMIGKGGDDTYVVDSLYDVVVESQLENQGVDRVISAVDFDLADANQSMGFVEHVTLSGAAATSAYGNGQNNILVGNAGNNTLDGREGVDRMVGRGGHDVYYVDSEADRVIEAANEGVDTVYANASFSLAGQHAEVLYLLGQANFVANGNGLDNTIVGNDGDNLIRGGDGRDTLTGGLGRDQFHFGSALVEANADWIMDFDTTQDRIRLDDAVFTGLTGPGRLAAAQFGFTSDGAATTADQRVIYNSSNGQLLYDADGSGAGAAIRFATISLGDLSLTNADFVVV